MPMGKALSIIAPIAGAALGGAIPGVGPLIGGSLASGLYTGVKTHNPLAGLAAAGGSYLGGSLGGQFLGGPTIGQTVNNAIGGTTLGNFVGNSISPALMNASVGSALGSFAGNSLATGLVPQSSGSSSGASGAPQFNPTREQSQTAPLSFSGLSSFSPEQVGSNIATKGIYGGGQGPQEQSYFVNLMNRRLIDDAGKVDTGLGDISPIENSYLGKLGITGNNPSNLLQAMSRWRTQQAA